MKSENGHFNCRKSQSIGVVLCALCLSSPGLALCYPPQSQTPTEEGRTTASKRDEGVPIASLVHGHGILTLLLQTGPMRSARRTNTDLGLDRSHIDIVAPGTCVHGFMNPGQTGTALSFRLPSPSMKLAATRKGRSGKVAGILVGVAMAGAGAYFIATSKETTTLQGAPICFSAHEPCLGGIDYQKPTVDYKKLGGGVALAVSGVSVAIASNGLSIRFKP